MPTSDISRISEFTTFLSVKSHPLSEILTHLVRVTFRDLGCEWISLSELNDNNEFITVGISGASVSAVNELSNKYSLSEHYPVSDTLKSGKIFYVSSIKDSTNEYPLLAKYPELLNKNSLFTVPISLSFTPVAEFAICCKENLALKDVDLEFLIAIADIFALSVYASQDFSSVDRKVERDIPHLKVKNFEDLTPRQVLISRLISEGRTNHDISQLIGYSESTVRQEIMKIFILTNSNSRRQVGEHYQSNQEDVKKEETEKKETKKDNLIP